MINTQIKRIDSTDFDLLECINKKTVSIPNTYAGEEGISEHTKVYENLIFSHSYAYNFANFNGGGKFAFFSNQRIYGLQ